MKLTKLVILLTFGFLLTQNISAQYTPESGSAERKAIMDALRIPVKRELKKPVIFGDVQLRVLGSWALVDSANPLNPDSSEFNYRGSTSNYAKCVNRGGDDCGDPQYGAVLKKIGGKWKVLKFDSGATDVWVGYACSQIKGCPKALHN